MQGKRLGLLAIGLLIMSETSSANASKKLLLETSQGQAVSYTHLRAHET